MKVESHAATFGRTRTSYPRLLRRRTRLVVVRLDACCRETPLTEPSISPSVPNAHLPFAELNLPALHGILPGISPEEERPCSIQTLLSASVW